MKKSARWLSLLSLGVSLTLLARLKDYFKNSLVLGLTPVKLAAAGLAPFVAALGALGGLLGLLTGAPFAFLAGLTGALISASYIRRIMTPHTGFSKVFGAAWPGRVTPTQSSRMLKERWTLQLPPDPPATVSRDLPFWTVPYAGFQLVCDLWQPPAGVQPSGLGVIYLHGGGWSTLDKGVLTDAFFRHLAAQGHVIMDVAYRMHPEADLQGALDDAQRAVAWMKQRGAEYGIDPAKIVLAGASSGGAMALLAAYAPGKEDFVPEDVGEVDLGAAGVIAFYAPSDLAAYYAFNDYGDEAAPVLDTIGLPDTRFVLADLLGGNPAQVPDAYAQYSALSYVHADCPPTLLLHGEQDSAVPVESSRKLAAALEAAGAPVIYVELPSNEHGFDLILPQVSPSAQAAWYDVERFLALLA